MSDELPLEATVHRYIASFNAADPEAIAALFSENGNVEDPIGSLRHVGTEALVRFYRAAINTGAKLELTGPIRVTGLYAAFPFCVRLETGGSELMIDVIDTMRFDHTGRIEEMRAYFNTAGVPDFLT